MKFPFIEIPAGQNYYFDFRATLAVMISEMAL